VRTDTIDTSASIIEPGLSTLAFAGFVLLLGLAFLHRFRRDDAAPPTGSYTLLAWGVAGIVIAGVGQAYHNFYAGGFGRVTGMEVIGLMIGGAIGAFHTGVLRRGRDSLNPPPGFGDHFSTRPPQPDSQGPPEGIQRGDSFTPPEEDKP
jgi:hypothetical protein